MKPNEADFVNRLFEELYQHKIEEVVHTNSESTAQYKTFRETETGISVFNPATATTFTSIIPFNKKYSTVFNASLDNIGTASDVVITDITQSQMTVRINATSTSTKVKFFWRVTGSLE
jgi:prophage DNA circulation protein